VGEKAGRHSSNNAYPRISGRSHVEVEETRWEDCEAGANVLLHCLLDSANEI
jgi:N-carbamoyl-L-amino-acid hydrolase